MDVNEAISKLTGIYENLKKHRELVEKTGIPTKKQVIIDGEDLELIDIALNAIKYRQCQEKMSFLDSLWSSPPSKRRLHKIERAIFSPPATIVFWEDGTKTVVKCMPEDEYNPEVGLAMATIKRCTEESYSKYRLNVKKIIGKYYKTNEIIEREQNSKCKFVRQSSEEALKTNCSFKCSWCNASVPNWLAYEAKYCYNCGKPVVGVEK